MNDGISMAVRGISDARYEGKFTRRHRTNKLDQTLETDGVILNSPALTAAGPQCKRTLPVAEQCAV